MTDVTDDASTPPEPDHPFGWVADTGEVHLRTAAGERVIGSWQAGSPAEGMAFYQRRYDDLLAEVALLEKRLATDAGDVKVIRRSARHLRDSLATAAVIGDVDALAARLAALDEHAVNRAAAQQAKRAEAAHEADAAKEVLVAEAEALVTSNDWKSTGERLRTIATDWRAMPSGDKRLDAQLWKRLAAARAEFTTRRGAHFAALDAQRTVSAGRKETLAAEAETLAESSEWAPTAARFKSLMTDWKSAGRAARDVDDALWARFRTAQDTFFARRNASYAERDAEFVGNQRVKEALAAEAEALDPGADLDGATARLRALQERWEAAGKVPRDVVGTLERRMEAVEERFRRAAEARWRTTSASTSPLVIRLRESVDKLEARLERAHKAGDEAAVAETSETLATQRQWLAQAENG